MNDLMLASPWTKLFLKIDPLSQNSQRAYRRVLEDWVAFLGGEVGTPEGWHALISATETHAELFAARMRRAEGMRERHQSYAPGDDTSPVVLGAGDDESGLAPATIIQRLAILRRIYSHLKTMKAVPFQIFDREIVRPPSRNLQKFPTEIASAEETAAMLNFPPAATVRGLRDRAILALLFGAGLRRMEVVGLTNKDIHSKEGAYSLRLRRTKAKKDVEQIIPDWVAERLEAYLSLYPVMKAKEKKPLFPSGFGPTARGVRLSESGVYRLVRQTARACGVTAHISPHSGRASAITALLDAGVSHREVAAFSRHSSVQMVEKYDKRRGEVSQATVNLIRYD